MLCATQSYPKMSSTRSTALRARLSTVSILRESLRAAQACTDVPASAFTLDKHSNQLRR